MKNKCCENCIGNPMAHDDSSGCQNVRCECHQPQKGIDYSKDNIYDAIGRPDLKPQQFPQKDYDLIGSKMGVSGKDEEPQQLQPEVKDWEEELSKEFCVMFERAGRETQTGEDWQICLENWIKNLLSSQRESIIEKLKHIERIHLSENSNPVYRVKDVLEILKK